MLSWGKASWYNKLPGPVAVAAAAAAAAVALRESKNSFSPSQLAFTGFVPCLPEKREKTYLLLLPLNFFFFYLPAPLVSQPARTIALTHLAEIAWAVFFSFFLLHQPTDWLTDCQWVTNYLTGYAVKKYLA